jgi:phosphate transport system substrate-binding protein
VNAVTKDKNGIGYGGSAYSKGIKVLKVKKDETSVAVSPELASIKAGTYPISRYLYMYTVKKPEGPIKAFIDWALSDAGQKVVSEVGYYSIR